MKNLYFLLLFTIGVVANDYALEGESSIKDIKSIGKKVENNHNTKVQSTTKGIRSIAKKVENQANKYIRILASKTNTIWIP